ncbi:ATP-binding protein [Longispora urticae]
MEAAGVLGRAEVLARCRARIEGGGGVLLHGPAGLGKTSIIEVLTAEAVARGEFVARSTARQAEAAVPYLALSELFGSAYREDTPLPGPLRAALETALLRRPPLDGTRVDPLAVRLAVLELVRRLTGDRRVLLVLDDAQWLDQPSREVLTFVARRCTDGRLRVLASERAPGGAIPELGGLLPAPGEEVELLPLPPDVVGELVRDRLDLPLPAPVLDRLYAASEGNPFLALELGRLLCRRPTLPWPTEPLPVPDRLRLVLADRLGALPAATRSALVLAAASSHPDLDPATDALRPALDSGVLVAQPDGRLQFGHPLLGDLLYTDASPGVRRAAHALLAGRSTDPVERARHLALAANGPDPWLADTLFGAAVEAERRGVPAAAAQLARLAAEHGAHDPAASTARLLASGRYAHAAGLADQAWEACASVLRADHRPSRVHARLLLIDLANADFTDAPDLLDAAEADADGDPALLARVHLVRAELALRRTRPDLVRAELARAEAYAERAGDDEALLECLDFRYELENVADPVDFSALLRRAAALAEGRELSRAALSIRRVVALGLVRAGEVAAALEAVTRVLADTERAGSTVALCDVLQAVARIQDRAGLCAASAESGRLAARLRIEIEPTPGRALYQRGTAELADGTVERAVELLDEAVALEERVGDTEWLAGALMSRGRADLLLDQPAQAARRFDRAVALLHGTGVHDPALVLIDADLAEALALSGAPDRAAAVLADARARADRFHRRVVLLGLDRVAALVEGITGSARDAADRLRGLIPGRHPYPLEIARAWLTLGELEVRARRVGAARSALVRAGELYARAGCRPWARYAAGRVGRLDAAGLPAPDTERRLIAFIEAGATNQEIARELRVSVKTVEAGLTRLYRRLGVRDRAALRRAVRNA